jgi:predicted nucleic acid-binding protein
LKKYLLDTNAIIYALNSGFKFPKCEYLVSIISEIELLSYSRLTKDDEQVLRILLLNLTNINITDDIKNETIKIRKMSKIKLPDSLIIATAIVEDAILITSDKQLLNSNLVRAIELIELK